MIQFFAVYFFLGLLVLIGFILVVWGWRLRSRCISMESEVPESVPGERHDEEAEWMDLSMSSEDTAITRTGLVGLLEPRGHSKIGSRKPEEIKREPSGWHQSQGLAAACSAPGWSLHFLRNLAARVVAILNRIRGLVTGVRKSDAPAEFTPTGLVETLNGPTDDDGCIARHGAGLSPQAPRSFLTYMERHRSRFTVSY